MKKTILLSVVVLLTLIGYTPAATRRVPDEYSTIQDAINAAVNGDVVSVAPDTYTGDGNRDIDFLGKAITVRSTDPNDPNIVAATIIDCQGTQTNQHRGFYFHNQEGPKSILAGFTIKYGNAKCGGGIYCIESSPTIVSCTFSDNMAVQYEYVYSLSIPEYGSSRIDNNSDIRIMCPPPPPQRRGNGAGICCVDSNAVVENCKFFNNYAYEQGGGMYSMSGDPTLINCTFTQNSAGGGGGMANLEGSSPTLKNCTFNENTAETGGGGMRNADNSNPALTNCTFQDNSAGWSGGLGNYYSSPTLTNCAFIGNSAVNNGGAINNYESNPVFINCIFTNNSAEVGGGIFSEYNSSSTLDNCTFSDNTAHHGGGIYCVSCSPNITNCTFTNNTAEYEDFTSMLSLETRDPTINDGNIVRVMCPPLPPTTTAKLKGIGGAIYSNQSKLTLTGSTFTNNSSFEYGGAIYDESDSNSSINDCIFKGNSAGSGGGIESHDSSLTLTNCIFTENSAVYGGGGIRNEFCNSILTNCTLNYNSAGWSGGVGNYHSSSTILSCTFIGNSADTDGGGMNNSESDIVQTNCIYSGNSAISGGALFSKDNIISVLTNCTFVENIAGYGGGFYCQNVPSSPPPPLPPQPPPPPPPPPYNTIFNNCILWGNEATDGPQIFLSPYSFALVSYSDVQGGWPGEGNIDADPYFIELGYWADINDPNIIVEPNHPSAIWVDGDYRLRIGSPCIDAGMDAGIYEDIDGNVRPFNFPGVDNNGELSDFDIGAYETVATMQGELMVIPRTINCSSQKQTILALIRQSKEISTNVIDIYEPFVLYPGEIEANSQFCVPTGQTDRSNVKIYAVFDKAKLLAAIQDNEHSEITVVGLLKSGEYFYCTDNVRIINARNSHRKDVYD